MPTVLTNETIILNNDPIATTLAENVSNNSGSGFQSSPSNVMNLSIVNGKIKDALAENQGTIIPIFWAEKGLYFQVSNLCQI